MNPRIALPHLAGLLLALALPCAWPAPAADDLLEPERAFRFSAQMIEPALIEVRYRIADGYYMYRDKFRFSTEPESVRLEKPHLPPGHIKEDEFFGRVATYRGELVIRLPLAAEPAASFTLKARSQGCADIGVCYVPLTQTVPIAPAAFLSKAASPSRESPGLLLRLKGEAQDPGGDEEFLPVEKAFSVEARAADARTVVARFAPADTYYLYRDKIRFSIAPGSKLKIDSVQLPRGEMKKDPNFGDTEVFHRPFQAVVRFKREADGPSRFVLNVTYQGCSDKGLCYVPVNKSFALVLAATNSAFPSPLAAPVTGAAAQEQAVDPSLAETRRIADLLGGGSFWLIVVSFLGFGLLLSFTPCMLPMIPILSGIIAGHGHRITHARGLVLSAAYVFGMAITYAIAGVAAGLSGSLLSSALQSPWTLGGFAAVFVLLALSMFGFYELQLPAALQTRMSGASNRLTGGTLTGVFAMGAISALIVGPCVAAPLAGALLYIGQTRDLVLGGSALFAMALGMGLPLLLLGVSAGALLPKAGAWMQTVKNFFGVMLVGVAIWMVSPIIPAIVHMLLWAALLIVSAIYLHALDPLPSEAGGARKLWKGVGVIALLAGIALMVGALSGGRDILQPLSGLRQVGVSRSGPTQAAFVRVKSVAELEAALANPGRPAMLDFYADWCISCKEMERFTYGEERVNRRLREMLLIQADVSANTEDDKALLQRFGLYGPPGVIFFDRDGRELKTPRVIGYQPAERFLAALEAAQRR